MGRCIFLRAPFFRLTARVIHKPQGSCRCSVTVLGKPRDASCVLKGMSQRCGVSQRPFGSFTGKPKLGPPVGPFDLFCGWEGSPTKIDETEKKGILILTSLLEDLEKEATSFGVPL